MHGYAKHLILAPWHYIKILCLVPMIFQPTIISIDKKFFFLRFFLYLIWNAIIIHKVTEANKMFSNVEVPPCYINKYSSEYICNINVNGKWRFIHFEKKKMKSEGKNENEESFFTRGMRRNSLTGSRSPNTNRSFHLIILTENSTSFNFIQIWILFFESLSISFGVRLMNCNCSTSTGRKMLELFYFSFLFTFASNINQCTICKVNKPCSGTDSLECRSNVQKLLLTLNLDLS